MKDAKENLWNMAMGIVICMVIAKSVHIHSVLTFPYPPACVINMALKRNNAARTDEQTIPSGTGFASIMVQSAITLWLTVERRCFRPECADITSENDARWCHRQLICAMLVFTPLSWTSPIKPHTRCLTTFICSGYEYGCVLATLPPLSSTKLLGIHLEIWVTPGQQMMVKCSDWGCRPNQDWSHINVRHMQGVWQHSNAVDVNMDASLQHYGHSHWPSFGKSPRNLGNSWATNDGEVQWLRL